MEANHWADQAALKIIAQAGDKEIYTVASGITPSGTVHIGNFREIITVDLVAKALRKLGKKVRFIFSWDDYDVFRKVPKNMPNQEMLTKFLRKPICSTPDPFGLTDSYAKHFEEEIENILPFVDVEPDFLYQSVKYKNSEYADTMRTAMQNREKIIEILNTHRTEPLETNWVPVSVFCESCMSNETDVHSYNGEYGLSYDCRDCGNKNTIDMRKSSCTKLLWRVDWPMRWAFEKVDFEPGGKDHSSEGGSYDTAKIIAKEIYGKDAPVYLMYDFVRIKGRGGKISSSSGDVITLEDVLEIYEPEIVRWIFASYRTNTEFAISFDLDVLKIYEDYDRLERQYFGIEKVGEDKLAKAKPIYEYSQIDSVKKTLPLQPQFRHLCNILQINGFDKNKTKAFYKNQIKNPYDDKKITARIDCAHNWINKYAPEDFKFIVNETQPNIAIEKDIEVAIRVLRETLIKSWDTFDEKSLYQKTYDIVNEAKADPIKFFQSVYRLLISKDNGPKLAGFILNIGKEKVIKLLEI